MWICVFNETDTRFLFMSGYGRDESAPTPNGLFATHFVGVCGYFTDCLLAFCVMFATHSQSVQNTFTECSQRVRYLCVTYSPCKSMVFGVQKGGFYIAKVWFLFFECCVVAICLECYHNPFAAEWQSVRNVLAIRQPCFGNPSAMFWQSVSHVLAIR